MRYNYVKPDFSFLEMELESVILNGSNSNKAIKVQNVIVEDYKNGFESNSFEEINFD